MSDYRQYITGLIERLGDRTAEGLLSLKGQPFILDEFHDRFFADLAGYESQAMLSAQIQDILHAWQIFKAISPEDIEQALEMPWLEAWIFLHRRVTPEQREAIAYVVAQADENEAERDEAADDDEGESWKRGVPSEWTPD